ncbi:hypothetical protein [Paraburkholderia diazotrophica]|uniref:hypothetical protein n=1 Tax=Paraburkholderia diazotrophica TaxID=667676 RepID=UPI00389951C7
MAVRRFVVDNAEGLRFIRLPKYCLELNLDELLNQERPHEVLLAKLREADRID